jgi:hypothetical protein
MYKVLLALVLLAGCSVKEHRKVMAPPPPKPVCPQGIKDDWCRPLVANEKGITNLGNKPDEE